MIKYYLMEKFCKPTNSTLKLLLSIILMDRLLLELIVKKNVKKFGLECLLLKSVQIPLELNKIKMHLMLAELKIWDVVTHSKEVDVMMDLILLIVFMKQLHHKEPINVPVLII